MKLFGKKDEGEDEEFIAAPMIVKNPEKISEISGKYAVLYNQTMRNFEFNDLIRAINRMAENNWRCVNIYPAGAVMYALMERMP